MSLPRILALLVGLGWSFAALGNLRSDAFEAANKLYAQGEFTKAAGAYEALLQSGQASEAIYFNLGNAFFKAGQLGRAIVAYHQAERLGPRDPDLRANLQFARNQVQGPTLSFTAWQKWLGRLSVNEWTVLASVALWSCLILLAVLQWRPLLKPTLRSYVVGLAAVTLLVGGCMAAALYETSPGRLAVAIKPEIAVRQGPMDESQSAFTVHDGAELRVLDQKDDWLQVSTDPRRIGWARKDHLFVLGYNPNPPLIEKAAK